MMARIPLAYRNAITLVSVALMVIVSAVISTALADRNARDLVARYEADKRATAAANRVVLCALFSSQLNAFEDATTPTGKESYKAWLQVYRLTQCEPERQ